MNTQTLFTLHEVSRSDALEQLGCFMITPAFEQNLINLPNKTKISNLKWVAIFRGKFFFQRQAKLRTKQLKLIFIKFLFCKIFSSV
jgi:hypothetical protein